MKRFMLIVGCCFFALALQAQWKIGPKVSYGTITQTSSKIEVVPQGNFQSYEIEYVGSSDVKSIGFMAINDLGPVFLQAEFLATTFSNNFYVVGFKSDMDPPRVYRENYFIAELPFAAGIKKGNFKLGGGPVMDVIVDTDSELSTMSNYRNTSKAMDFGFQGLIGYNLGLVHFDLRYVNKFTSIVDGFAFGYDRMKYKKSANRLTMSVGLTF